MLKGTARWPSWAMQKRGSSTPVDIFNLSDIWLQGDTRVIDGSNNITQWTDTSHVGTNHATAAVGGPNGTTALLNGHLGATGNGSSSRLNFAGLTMGTNNTMAMVGTVGSALSCAVGWTGSLGILWRHTFNQEWFNNPDVQQYSAGTAGTGILVMTQVDGVSLVGYFNGVQAFSVVPGVVLAAKQILTLFCRSGGDLFSDGKLYEYIHMPSALNGPNAVTLSNQLKTKYGL